MLCQTLASEMVSVENQYNSKECLGCDNQHMQSFAPEQNSDQIIFPVSIKTYYPLGWLLTRLSSRSVFPSWINKSRYRFQNKLVSEKCGDADSSRQLRAPLLFEIWISVPAGLICGLPLLQAAVGFCVCISNPTSPSRGRGAGSILAEGSSPSAWLHFVVSQVKGSRVFTCSALALRATFF